MRIWTWVLPPTFFGLLILLALGLGSDPREIPSPLVGQPFPTISGLNLNGEPAALGAEALARPLVVNVWASWCAACVDEHPAITQAAERFRDRVDFVGIDYQDSQTAGQRWLDRLGNPYAWSLQDVDGRAGLELGVYGVPETFFVDLNGIITAKHTGPLSPADIDGYLAPLLAER